MHHIKYIVALLFCSMNAVCAFAQTAKWMVPPDYSDITVLSESLLRVEKNGQYGLIDVNGKMIASCEYSAITDVVENRILMLSSSDRLLAISDGDGNSVKRFSNPERWFVDSQYPYFSEGFLAVCDSYGNWCYLDKSGAVVKHKLKYRKASPFIHGCAVVLYDNSYMHINRNGNVNRLDNEFKNNALSYASAFTKDLESDSFHSIIVDTGMNVYIRDYIGRKIKSLGKFKGYDKSALKMTTDQFIILFTANRQIISIKSIKKGTIVQYDTLFVDKYSPSVNDLACTKTDAGYNIMSGNIEILPAQFPMPASFISDTEFIVRKGSGVGVLGIDRDCSYFLDFRKDPLIFQHHVPVEVSASFKSDGGVMVPNLYFTITGTTGILFDGPSQNGFVSFAILPDNLTEKGVEKIRVQTSVDGILHPEYKYVQQFSYENPFSVAMPNRVKLNKSNSAGGVPITIVNESVSDSDVCDILIDGAIFKQGVIFRGGEHYTFTVSEYVNIEDKDSVSKTVSVQIKENGCPEFNTSKVITFERNL